LFEPGKFMIPRYFHRTYYDGKTVDLIPAFVEEWVGSKSVKWTRVPAGRIT
jgi:hypothetical protein